MMGIWDVNRSCTPVELSLCFEAIDDFQKLITLGQTQLGQPRGHRGNMEMKGKGGRHTPFVVQTDLWAQQKSLF
ncbi:hypothetical protein SKAU_G00229440 [Synaphobranchus kaupii]|uniref:Uncharacterized protein n=1 Tax=Synaphobranchus kaupii TaxID=118154 RepID=A0A9Q1F5C9_SYNKA|nr:hypothetical protein SKAU_G00229440 [Synaphobranchus kaupii]